MKRWGFILGVLAFLILNVAPSMATTEFSKDVKNPKVQELNKKCVMCHLKENKSLVFQWENSPHAAAKEGPVGCYTCHATEKGDEWGFLHEGAYIRTLQTPKDCGMCHDRETKEMMRSHHATAGEIMASLDNVLGEIIGSIPAGDYPKADAVNGCWQCHGSVVKLVRDKSGKIKRKTLYDREGKPLKNDTGAPLIDWMTWPNTGIGRINPDGTKGSCHACHSKHSFRASVARQPYACCKCHLGPDHPQKEVYEESKHGIAYFSTTRGPGMNGMDILKSGKWILGKDYYFAPTCSTCHMGQFVKSNGSVAQNTHNVGDRISWNLRAPLSIKLNRVIFVDGTETDIPGEIPPQPGQTAKMKTYVRKGDKLVKQVVEKRIQKVISWRDRRAAMQGVCKSCHGMSQVTQFYQQFDALVYTYNEKFIKPGLKLVNELKKDGLWKGTEFQNPIGWYWFEIWHHEGRRTRMAAAMNGPDYVHWHGMYEIARHFYTEFLPLVQERAEQGGKGEKYKAMIQEILSKPEHIWTRTGGSAEVLKLIKEERKLRYGQ